MTQLIFEWFIIRLRSDGTGQLELGQIQHQLSIDTLVVARSSTIVPSSTLIQVGDIRVEDCCRLFRIR